MFTLCRAFMCVRVCIDYAIKVRNAHLRTNPDSSRAVSSELRKILSYAPGDDHILDVVAATADEVCGLRLTSLAGLCL